MIDKKEIEASISCDNLAEFIVLTKERAINEKVSWYRSSSNPGVAQSINSIQMALTCNATKIFHYLLSLPDIEINHDGNDRTTGLLNIALEHHKYQEAQMIIAHQCFNPCLPEHLACWLNPPVRVECNDTKIKPAYLETMKTYMQTFKLGDLLQDTIATTLLQFISISQEAYNCINNVFVNLLKSHQSPPKDFTDLLDIYRHKSHLFTALSNKVFSSNSPLSTHYTSSDVARYLKGMMNEQNLRGRFHIRLGSSNTDTINETLKILTINPPALKEFFEFFPELWTKIGLENTKMLQRLGLNFWPQPTLGSWEKSGLKAVLLHPPSLEPALKQTIDYHIENHAGTIQAILHLHHVSLEEYPYARRLLEHCLLEKSLPLGLASYRRHKI